MPKNLYSEQDDEFLRANYLEMSNAVLAEHLGRTVRSVEKKAFERARSEANSAGHGSYSPEGGGHSQQGRT